MLATRTTLATRRSAIAWAIASLVLAAPAWAQDDPDGDSSKRTSRSAEFRWEGRLAAGRTLEVRNVQGRIKVANGTGDRVEVVARKYGQRSDPDRVRIEVAQDDEGLVFCAVYSQRDDGNPCGREGHGRMNTEDIDVRVDFSVRLPRGVSVVLHNVNGDIEALDLENDVDAKTVNGSVHIQTAGSAEAETVNGSIEAAFGRRGWKESLQFKTVNGNIDLTLPRQARADVRGDTFNGEVDSEFPLEIERGRWHGVHARGTIGGGGPRLALSTLNGNIVLKRSGGSRTD